ncbi:MAG: hypothetical protein U9N10_08255 [Bacillota bacterium]|nr:hypothetical protein [Bacillota bacterium]
MLNLIKYEWKRKWMFVTIGLVILLFSNVSIYFRGVDPETQILSLIGYNMVLFFISIIFLFVTHVRKMSRLLFTEEGQFTFLTPLNGYEILGANFIGVFIDIFLLLITFSTIMLINFKLNDIEIVRQSIDYVRVTGFNIPEMMQVLLSSILVSYSLLLVSIYLSMILVKTLFYNVKIKMILSFIVFILVSKVNSFIGGALSNFSINPEGIVTEILLMSLFKVLIIVIFWYLVSGYLLEEKVSA